MKIQEIPLEKPKSPDSFVQLIRLIMDLAFRERLVYLKISYRKRNDVKNIEMSIQG